MGASERYIQWMIDHYGESREDVVKRLRFDEVVDPNYDIPARPRGSLTRSRGAIFLIDEHDKLGREEFIHNLRSGKYDEQMRVKQIGPVGLKQIKDAFGGAIETKAQTSAEQPAPQRTAAPKPEPAQATTYTITTTKYWEHVNLCHYMYLLSSEAEHKGIFNEELAAVSLLLQRVMDSWRHWNVDRAEERIFVSTIERVLAEFREEDQPDET